MVDQLPTLASAVVGDLFTALQLPGANSAGLVIQTALQSVLRRRIETARATLIAELRRGERHLADPEIEEMVSILYRYIRAAQEGTAHKNIQLMARVIAGQMEAGTLFADEFLRYADTLASLKREEVVLLGTICRLMTASGTTEED